MAPRTPPSKEDQDVAIAVLMMAASAQMLDEGTDDIMSLALMLWPKTIHRDVLSYGPAALIALCAAFGIDSVQVSTLAQHLVAH